MLQRELTERWRSTRATATLTAYLALLSLLLYLLYRAGASVLAAELGPFDPGAAAGPLLGRFLLESLLMLVLLLVLFVAPGYAAAQLSGERERRTLPLLQATLLRPRQIVLGKLGAAVAWIMVLIVAALPLGATAFFLGGVTVGELLRGIGFIAAIGLCVAAIALGISSLTRRTTASVVLTYATVLALTGGTLFLSGVELVIRSATGRAMVVPAALHANPFVGLADAVVGRDRLGFGMGRLPLPLTGIASALPSRPDPWMNDPLAERGMAIEEPVRMIGEPLPVPPPPPLDPAAPYVDPALPPPGPGVVVDPDPRAARPEAERSMWQWVLGVHGALALAGLTVASRRLRTGETRPRLRAPRRGDADAGLEGAPR
ncbi:MAG TPA: ABC transporter permease [Egibacteraceae bacterium]|nr:ABC transporter permease [Egibacteraceae bacterium]